MINELRPILLIKSSIISIARSSKPFINFHFNSQQQIYPPKNPYSCLEYAVAIIFYDLEKCLYIILEFDAQEFIFIHSFIYLLRFESREKLATI